MQQNSVIDRISADMSELLDDLATRFAAAGITWDGANVRLSVVASTDNQPPKTAVTISYGHNAKYEIGTLAAAKKLIADKLAYIEDAEPLTDLDLPALPEFRPMDLASALDNFPSFNEPG